MSRPDAERALAIYKVFTKLTELVIAHLATARHHERQLLIEIPKLKHAPTSLGSALEDYLLDRDFETNRRQYLAEREAKKGGKFLGASSASSAALARAAPRVTASGTAFPSVNEPSSAVTQNATSHTKGPSTDLIDFFASIDLEQRPMAQQPTQYSQQAAFSSDPFQQQAGLVPQQAGFDQNNAFPPHQTGNPSQQAAQQSSFDQNNAFSPQQTGYPSQQAATHSGLAAQPDMMNAQSGMFAPQQGAGSFGQQPQAAPIQTQFTGAGFGGYTPQPSSQPQPQFQTVPTDFVSQFSPIQMQTQSIGLQRQATNPFRQNTVSSNASADPFGQSPEVRSPAQSTNPFGRNTPMAIPEDVTVQSFSPPPFPPPQTQAPSFAQPQHTGSPFGASSQPQIHQPVAPQQTGTNPFARNASPASPPPPPIGLQPQPTGTNPFRQSAFMNQATGQGWQNGPQGTISGFPSGAFETVPVFPRPAGQLLPDLGQQQSPQQPLQ